LRFTIGHAAKAVFPNAVGAQRFPSSWTLIPATAVLLDRPKLTIEFRYDWCAREPFFANFGPNVMRAQKGHYLSQTPARHGNVMGEILAARDYARFGICRKPHRLRLVKLRGLECRQPEQTIQHGRWQALLVHVKKIRADDLCRFRECSLNRPLRLPSRRWQCPGILCIFVIGNTDANPDQIAIALS